MSNLTLESLAHLATYLSAIVAALFALSSIRSSRDSKLEAGRANENADKANVLANDANAYATDANRYAQQANDYAKEANVLGAKSWADQYFANVREWADEGSNAISTGIHLNDIDDEHLRVVRWFEVRATLSALVDRGRWYFPNQKHERIGLHKQPAYRGYRQPILTHLLRAYQALSSPSEVGKQQVRDKLVEAQRSFVSEVQRILDPRKREDEMRIVLEHFAVSEQLRQAKSESAQSSETDEKSQ